MVRLLWIALVLAALCFGAGHYDASSGSHRTIDAGGNGQLDMGSGPSMSKEALALSIAVTDEYMVIGARGGFMPNVYYKVFDGQYGPLYAAIQKESEEDPGRVIWAVYSSRDMKPDSVYVDKNNRFLSAPGDGYLGMNEPENLELPSPGTYLSTLAPNSARRVRGNDVGIAPLSAFDIIAKDLIAIRKQFGDLEDVDDVGLIFNGSFYGNNRLRGLRPLMGAIKVAGFKNVCLAFLDDDEGFIAQASQEAERELYRPFDLKPSRNCSFELLSAQPKTASAAAYELMKNQKFTKDIDRILKDVAGLQTDGGADGIGDGLAGLFVGGGGDGAATKAKGNVETPSESDVIIGSGGFRSVADIMKVVRQRAPGLRHIYNKFLNKKPGFQGKVTLKFTIAPGGEVISISIASSTTGYGEFDREIKNAVSRWSFSKVESGNTTVTIPFTFSE